MEPSTKKRKLAPKINSANTKSQPPHDTHYITSEASYIADRHDFESFARHLQDAAMLIQRQAERQPYADASVLLLRWEDDDSADDDLTALEQIFATQYRYRTQRWHIPTVANPSIKLGVQMAQFLENARPNHLLIVYYAGYGFVGPDGQLYWACNACSAAAKLKYDGIRCLFEDAASDILLLLDTCAIPNPPVSGSHGVKQAIAACNPEQTARSAPDHSFTTVLIEALRKLETRGPFSAQRLHEEILSLQQRHSSHLQALNGVRVLSPPLYTPIFFTLTPDNGQNLILAPITDCNLSNTMETSLRSNEEQLIDQELATDLRFDEVRILVCTTFVGDASPDMSSFRRWLENTPAMGAKIAVEGMFLGPPTMLLISMPHSVWNVVQQDRVCCFLGYISSHNMLHMYEKLVGPLLEKPSMEDNEDSRPSQGIKESSIMPLCGGNEDEIREIKSPPLREPRGDTRPSVLSQGGASGPLYHSILTDDNAQKPSENEGSQEMREAAEQLKALSHVRHRSDEEAHPPERPRTILPNGLPETRNEHGTAYELGIDSSTLLEDKSGINRVKVPRRVPSKQDTQCSHCSHAPFRDSSSLRKHIAAAHTRPFPCAFSFAGCTSTFGSKNEWKRHITSQHLCLQFYQCSQCPRSTTEGKGNEFNRKDLFTQHLRRMHAPFHIKRAVSKGDTKLQAEWDSHVKGMQQSCLVQRRHPPQRSACPNPDCQSIFEGHGSWDEWTEHVGRHMEKNEGHKLSVDGLLVDWALNENIIEPTENGQYRLVASTGVGGNASGGENGHLLKRNSHLIPFDEAHQLADNAVKLSDATASAMEVD